MKKDLVKTKLSDNQLILLASAIATLVATAVTSSITIGLAFTILTALGTKQFIKNRKVNRYTQLGQIWPEIIDHLVSALYSGLSITEALAALAVRGPEITKDDFREFESEIRSGVELDRALTNLRDKFAHPGSDQIFEALFLSKTLGGGELINILRTLGSFQREDLFLKREISIKHGWVKNSAHISAIAPWILLLMIGTQPGTASTFTSTTGVMILLSGLVMTLIAYFWMSKISNLPLTPRVFK